MSIGETLAQARRDTGLTLAQVSERTRIRETVIRCMEADDFSLCGGNFYARGHIRSIAKVVGTDPEPLVRDYDDAHGGAPAAISVATAFEPERPVQFRERRSTNWSAAMAAALSLVVIYAVVQMFSTDTTRQAEPVAKSSPAATVTPVERVKPQAKPKDAIAMAPRGKVTLAVKATKASWVNVRDSKGRQLFSGLIAKGGTKTWTDAKRLRILIGNGGGLTLTVNGKSIGAPGADGSVVRLSFEPGDPKKT